MNQAAGAIIAFPCQGEARLRVALRKLELALDDQALAFQEFRLNMWSGPHQTGHMACWMDCCWMNSRGEWKRNPL